MNLFEEIGESVPDNLIADIKVKPITRGITLMKGQGKLKRGTLIGKNSDGKGILYRGAAETSLDGILCDDVDTGNEENGMDVVCETYITGIFNKNEVVVDEGVQLEKYIEELRKLGIFFEEVME